ncbi:hypothetical protein [Vitiosangium sp. GDMCC 1.1324]|uniref:hypothetical protein n=1 Tax=Vitiosangium sp. (strain GDMCC 1.1324) TaxID=2138576 RepID=UPI000D3CAD0F|nr:hypothetical protein [Vitiosangium sp. GDMCC 1.1324]PTL84870.1 hypothetical protein DAT35_07385 [Vitiosangium sp. GDMCC 1.1324]
MAHSLLQGTVMNLRQILLLCPVVLSLGCGGSDNVVHEEVGAATYFLDNQSSHVLRVEWKTTVQLGSETQNVGSVPSGTVKELLSDSIFGVNPRPTDTFESLALYRVDTGGRVYLQEPIRDEAWVSERKDSRYLGTTHHTLRIRDEDLSP